MGILDERPPGSCILRLEEPTQNSKSLFVLIIIILIAILFIKKYYSLRLKASYKYKTFIFTHTFEKIVFKISVARGSNVVKCKTNPKNYKYIRSLSAEFLPTLRLFINEFVNNHNFIGKGVHSRQIGFTIINSNKNK